MKTKEFNKDEITDPRQILQQEIMKSARGNSKVSKACYELSLNPGPNRKIKNILIIKSPTIIWEKDQHSISTNITEEVPEPLGPAYLAAVLRKNGYNPMIFDPHLEGYDEYILKQDPDIVRNKLTERLKNIDYDIVGVSSMFTYAYKWAHFCCSEVKKINANIPVILGGGYPTVVLKEVMNDKNIDYVVEGEGEATLTHLLYELNNKPNTVSAVKNIGGLIYRNERNEIIHNERTNFIWNLDEIPFPAWDLVDLNRYLSTYSGSGTAHEYRKKTAIMITERGCPFKCTFCNVFQGWGYKFRSRSAENVLEEIDYLMENTDVEEIMFVDDNITINKKRMMELCKGLKKRPITWGVINAAAFVTNEEMIRAMKDSGCRKFSISVESGSEKVLKDMKKPVDLEWSKNLINICHDIDLPISVNYVTGMPYETKEDMMKTFKWAGENKADWMTFSMLVPYVGTEIYNYSVKMGYINEEKNILGATPKNVTIETEEWSREWVKETTYYYNILYNFLRNRNLYNQSQNKMKFLIEILGNICGQHVNHIIAWITLAYAQNINKNSKEVDKCLNHASSLLSNIEVINIFGKYLQMNEEPVILFFHEFLAAKKIKNYFVVN
jgi:anaerobic magnesium-protoporphyrin IX monomethyl ester cyclase